MVVETLWPDNAPWWLNLFIWMATFWWYILVGFVPAFYIAVAKLFGMPLLQRWSNEVVIMLYPTKVKFGKIKEQYEPYIKHGKGVYWLDSPLSPEVYQELDPKLEEKLVKLKAQYDELAKPENETPNKEKLMKRLLIRQKLIKKKVVTVDPRNSIHIFTHAVNQPIYKMDRRQSKVDEILHNEANPKKIAGHGVWLMQNPKLHFHRHFQLFIDPTGSLYKLVPVKERQQFSIGFWHSLGIVMQKEVEIEEQKELDGSTSKAAGKQLIGTVVTTHIVLEQMKVVQDYQNFSASRAFKLLQRRAKLESPYGFNAWIQGSFDVRILLLLAGMVGVVAVIFLMFHGGGGSTTPGTPPSAGVKIL